jgi:hypothetical protein
MKKKVVAISVLAITLAFLSMSVVAAEEEKKVMPWEKFSLSLGGFITTVNSDVRIGSQTAGIGIDVNPEDALGLDSSVFVFRADASYRFTENRRHRFDLSYIDLRRSATRTIQRDIQFRDHTFTAGTTLDTLFDIQLIRGAYSYSLYQDDRIDLGLSFGAYVAPIKLRLSSSTSGNAEEQNVTAPLPVLGLRFDFAITPKLFLKQGLDVFYMQYGNFQGSLIDAKVNVEYNIWKHVGVGVGYDYFRIMIKADGDNYPGTNLVGQIQFNYGGLLLYGKYFF